MSRVGEVRDWQVDAGDGPLTYQPQPVMRLSSILMLHQAVHARRGAAILPWSLVAGDVASDRLSNWACVQSPGKGLGAARIVAAIEPQGHELCIVPAAQFPYGKLEVRAL